MRALILTVFFALITLVLTAYSLYTTHLRSAIFLPTPTIAHVLAIVLPFLTFLATLCYSRIRLFARSKIFAQINPAFFLSILSIFDAVLVTLAGSDLRSDVQTCLLETRWTEAFHLKNEGLIRGVQETLQCCGLRSTKDRAWPFQDKSHGVDACVVRYGYSNSCEGPWEQREYGVLVSMIVVGVVGLVAKVVFLYLNRERPEWIGVDRRGGFERMQGLITEEAQTENESRDIERYLDEPEETQDTLSRDST